MTQITPQINRNLLLGIVALCRSSFLDEYSLQQLLERAAIQDAAHLVKNRSFLVKFLEFIKAVPLSYFNNDRQKRGELLKTIQLLIAKNNNLSTGGLIRLPPPTIYYI